MNHVKTYSTKDFYISCILRALNFNLVETQRANGNFVTFVFHDPENKAEEVISHYWNKNIQVDARTIIEAINEMKTRLYSKS